MLHAQTPDTGTYASRAELRQKIEDAIQDTLDLEEREEETHPNFLVGRHAHRSADTEPPPPGIPKQNSLMTRIDNALVSFLRFKS